MSKKRLFFLGAIVILCYLGIYTYSPNKVMKSSYIYNKMIDFRTSGKWKDEKGNTSVLKGSAEYYFFKGIDFYIQKDIKSAEKYLKKAASAKYTDVALPVYLNFYLNQCEVSKNGQGDFYYIEQILDYIQKFPILANDVELISQTVSTVLTDRESRQKVIDLLKEYNSQTKKLSLITELKLKRISASLKVVNEDYAESIYDFYEIITESGKIRDKNEKTAMQISAQEYIANIYFSLEDYEKAIEEYDKIINFEISDSRENIWLKYGSYMNRISAYIHQEDYQTAQQCAKEVFQVLPSLPEDMKQEIKISLYDSMALVKIEENDLKQAKIYLEKCNKLLAKSDNYLFLNNDIYVAITSCKLLICEGKNQEAIKKLNELATKNEKEKWGFESTIYSMLIDLYQKTNQVEKYFQLNNKLTKIEKEKNQKITKEYVSFAEKAYKLEQLKKKERISNILIELLIGMFILILLFILIQLVRMRKLKENGFVDQLTEVYNRKYLSEFIQKTLKRQNEPLNMGIIMVDIDYFKKYNDTYGHIAGDRAIREVADTLKSVIKHNGIVIRYGGEEFLILLKIGDNSTIKDIYEDISQHLEEKHIIHEKSDVSDCVTLSLGASNKKIFNSDDLFQAIKEADEALYRAKQNGRNQIVFFDD